MCQKWRVQRQHLKSCLQENWGLGGLKGLTSTQECTDVHRHTHRAKSLGWGWKIGHWEPVPGETEARGGAAVGQNTVGGEGEVFPPPQRDPPSALPIRQPQGTAWPPQSHPCPWQSCHRCPPRGLSQPRVPLPRCPCDPSEGPLPVPKRPVSLSQARCLPCSPARLSQPGLAALGAQQCLHLLEKQTLGHSSPELQPPHTPWGPGRLPAPTPRLEGGWPWLPNKREAAAPAGWARAAGEERGNWGFSLISCFKMHFIAQGGEGSRLQLLLVPGAVGAPWEAGLGW